MASEILKSEFMSNEGGGEGVQGKSQKWKMKRRKRNKFSN